MVMINSDMLINIKVGYFLILYWNCLCNVLFGKIKNNLVKILEIVKFKDNILIWNNNCEYLESIIIEMMFFIVMSILIKRKNWK